MTSIVCPKCDYKRKPGDGAIPDWQCPACGIVYAKFGTDPHPGAHNPGSGFVQAGQAARKADDADGPGGFVNRLIYAMLGGIVGCVIGVVCWVLYGLGFSPSFSQWHSAPLDTNILHWVYGSGGLMALYGFFFKAGAADIAGDKMQGIVDDETEDSGEFELPLWAQIVLGFGVFAICIWLYRHHS